MMKRSEYYKDSKLSQDDMMFYLDTSFELVINKSVRAVDTFIIDFFDITREYEEYDPVSLAITCSFLGYNSILGLVEIDYPEIYAEMEILDWISDRKSFEEFADETIYAYRQASNRNKIIPAHVVTYTIPTGNDEINIDHFGLVLSEYYNFLKSEMTLKERTEYIHVIIQEEKKWLEELHIHGIIPNAKYSIEELYRPLNGSLMTIAQMFEWPCDLRLWGGFDAMLSLEHVFPGIKDTFWLKILSKKKFSIEALYSVRELLLSFIDRLPSVSR